MPLQLENYAKTEEAKVEELIRAVAESGAKVIVSGAAIGEMALHFCERYKCDHSPYPFLLLDCIMPDSTYFYISLLLYAWIC